MEEKVLTILLFAFLVLFFSSVAIYYKEVSQIRTFEISKLEQFECSRICFDKNCFSLEKAETEKERRLGLMFRESLEKDQGMIFNFKKEDRYGIWMKNTFIPLDIIWLNKNLEIVFIKENAEPCKEDPCPLYQNSIPAQYVLEINGGEVEKFNLKINDKARCLTF